MTSEELTRRWLTPEGARLRMLVIEGSDQRMGNLAQQFSRHSQLPDRIDLRGINLRPSV